MKEFFENVKYTFSNYRKAILIILSCIALEQTIFILIPYYMGEIADVLMGGEGLDYFYQSFPYIVGILLLGILSRFIFWQREKAEIKYLSFDLGRNNFMTGIIHHMGLSGGQHISENSEKRRSTISRGTASATTLSQMFFYEILPDIIKTIIVFIALFIFSPVIGGVVFLVFSINLVLQIRMTSRLMPDFDKWQKMMKKQDKIAGEHSKNIMLTKNFGQEERAKREIEEVFLETDNHAKKIWYTFMKKLITINSSVPLARGLAMVILAYQVPMGMMTIGEYFFVIMWVNMSMSQVMRVQYFQRRIMKLLPAFRDLKKEYEVKGDIEVVKNPISGIIQHGKIEFRDVSFSYKNNDNAPGLKSASITILPGQKIGITGASGAGKSTFINLLLRNFDPESGLIEIDGNDLRLLDLEEYKSTSIGYVSQDNLLFDKSVRYNVAYSGNNISDKEIIKALKIANLHDRIMKHKDGLDAQIGERGINLSGGEKQRLSIARAVVKSPKILIFDEATSSVDSQNEKEIQDTLDRASEGKTMIAIAHRLPTIQNADMILFFDEGRIAAAGSHEELLQQSEKYAELCSFQSLKVV
ncbi:ABC transporter ATP-binding protein [Candidatus Parcubacteria bacterium]|nr:ABC transporter ATP-binding protein [Candidatus Parcubacteria bacterium]